MSDTNVISDSDQEMAEAGIIEMPVQEKIKPTAAAKPGDEDLEDEELDENGEKKVKDKPKKDVAPKPDSKVKKNGEKPDEEAEETDDDDIEEEKLVKAFNKKTGKNYKTLAEIQQAAEPKKILTPDEEAEAREKRKEDAFKFGLEKKLFKKKDYDNYLIFNERPKVDVVKEDFAIEIRKEEPDLSDDDVEERFNELYHQFDDDKSFKYKKGQEQINTIYEKIKNEKFGPIVKIEEVYEGVQKNLNNGRIFKSEVDSTFEKLEPKLNFTIDGEQITATLFTPEQAETIKQTYLNSEMMNAILTEDGKIDTAALTEEIRKDFIYDNLNAIVEEAAKSLADLKVVAYKKARKAANFSEDALEGDIPANQGTKSASDVELDQAKKDGII